MHFLNPRKFVTHIINAIIDRNYYSISLARETLSAQCSFSSIPLYAGSPPPSTWSLNTTTTTIHNNSSTSAAIHTILKELYNNNNWQYPQQQQQFTRVQPPLSQSQIATLITRLCHPEWHDKNSYNEQVVDTFQIHFITILSLNLSRQTLTRVGVFAWANKTKPTFAYHYYSPIARNSA